MHVWYALLGPTGLPVAVLSRLNTEMIAFYDDAHVDADNPCIEGLSVGLAVVKGAFFAQVFS